MVFIIFILSAIVTILAAMKLSSYADEISTKTSIGGFLVGTILLAGATSLPEVTTSISAVFINNPDIAVGNVLGSNLFNIFILAVVDLFYRRNKMLINASKEHLYTASVGILLTTIVLFSLHFNINKTIFSIGIDSLLIIAIYFIGVNFISKLTSKEKVGQANMEMLNDVKFDKNFSVKKTLFYFALTALVILFTGTILSITGDEIATITGMSSSFVGSFLIAATTSLPEAVAVLSAVRLRNYNLAIGAVLGSNMFNMLIISGADIFYKDGAILANVAPVHEITAIATIALAIVVLYQLLRRPTKSAISYSLPSILLIVIYIIASFLIFNAN